MGMAEAANSEVDYARAVAAGEHGMADRARLMTMNPTFTTSQNIGEHGYACRPGETQQYEEPLPITKRDPAPY